jgi:hypothetical protein
MPRRSGYLGNAHAGSNVEALAGSQATSVLTIARKCDIDMPTLQEDFEAMMENDPVHGPTFRAIRMRPPELVKLSVKDTAAYLEKAVRTIRRWQADGRMPQRVKVGRERRYRLLDIQELKKTLLAGA